MEFYIESETTIVLNLLNSRYIDQMTAEVFVSYNRTTDFNFNGSSIIVPNGITKAVVRNNFKEVLVETCQTSASFLFKNSTSGLPWKGDLVHFEEVQVDLSINSSNCSFGVFSQSKINDFSVEFLLKSDSKGIESFRKNRKQSRSH